MLSFHHVTLKLTDNYYYHYNIMVVVVVVLHFSVLITLTGESFDVIVGVDWSPAETFFWPSPKDSDSNYINAQLTSTYLDQASGEVVKTKDFPSVGNFLTVRLGGNKSF